MCIFIKGMFNPLKSSLQLEAGNLNVRKDCLTSWESGSLQDVYLRSFSLGGGTLSPCLQGVREWMRQASSWVSLRGTLALRYWLHSCDPYHLQKGHVSEYESLCSTCTGAGFDMSIWGGHKCLSHHRDLHTSAMIYSLQWEVSTFALTLSAHRSSYGAGTPHPLIWVLIELFFSTNLQGLSCSPLCLSTRETSLIITGYAQAAVWKGIS